MSKKKHKSLQQPDNVSIIKILYYPFKLIFNFIGLLFHLIIAALIFILKVLEKLIDDDNDNNKDKSNDNSFNDDSDFYPL